jgi:hypothetical protein
VKEETKKKQAARTAQILQLERNLHLLCQPERKIGVAVK